MQMHMECGRLQDAVFRQLGEDELPEVGVEGSDAAIAGAVLPRQARLLMLHGHGLATTPSEIERPNNLYTYLFTRSMHSSQGRMPRRGPATAPTRLPGCPDDIAG